MTRYELIIRAAEDFISNMRKEHPETADPSTIRCPFVRALEFAVSSAPTPRDVVYDALNSERDYQDKVWAENAGKIAGAHVRTVAEEGYMLEAYAQKARDAWLVAPRNTEVAVTTDILRKCGGIVVRAMENHGAPKRG